MELIVHLGVHRTGSTSFQASLSNNRGILQAEGIALWTPQVLRQMAGFSKTVMMVRGGQAPALKTMLARECDQLQADGMRQLLISEENIIGTMEANLRRASLYPDATERLQAYAQILPVAPKRIAIGVRNLIDYWVSVYGYVLDTAKALPQPFDKLAPRLAQAGGWLPLIETVRHVFPNAEIVVWPMEERAHQPLKNACEVLGRATGHTGLRGKKIFRNKGLRPEVFGMAHALRAQTPGLTQKALQDALTKALDARDPDANLPQMVFFNPAQRAALGAQYAADLAQLAQGHAGAVLWSGSCA